METTAVHLKPSSKSINLDSSSLKVKARFESRPAGKMPSSVSEPTPNDASDQAMARIRALIVKEDLVRLAQVLKVFALKRMKYAGDSIGWPKSNEDFVQDAIIDTYSGKRKWDSHLKPNLTGFLMDVIKSNISNCLTRAESKDISLELLKSDPSERATEMDLMLDLESHLTDEPELMDIVRLYFEDMVKPADVANELHISVEELANRRKRLRRRTMDFFEMELQHEANEKA